MAISKIRAEVRINGVPGANDIDLVLAPEQSVKLLEQLVTGEMVKINLWTLDNTGHVQENPAAYAQ